MADRVAFKLSWELTQKIRLRGFGMGVIMLCMSVAYAAKNNRCFHFEFGRSPPGSTDEKISQDIKGVNSNNIH